MKKWLFNPFIYVAGSKSLYIGWALMILTALIGSISHTRFDGILDVHSVISSGYVYFAEQLVVWGTLVIFFYAAGRIFSSSQVRLIDVAGTMALARWVMILAALAGFGIDAHETAAMAKLPPKEMVQAIKSSMIIVAIAQLCAIVWMVALMFNAFRVSCNLKGEKATLIFIVVLIAAEVVSRYLLSFV